MAAHAEDDADRAALRGVLQEADEHGAELAALRGALHDAEQEAALQRLRSASLEELVANLLLEAEAQEARRMRLRSPAAPRVRAVEEARVALAEGSAALVAAHEHSFRIMAMRLSAMSEQVPPHPHPPPSPSPSPSLALTLTLALMSEQVSSLMSSLPLAPSQLPALTISSPTSEWTDDSQPSPSSPPPLSPIDLSPSAGSPGSAVPLLWLSPQASEDWAAPSTFLIWQAGVRAPS